MPALIRIAVVLALVLAAGTARAERVVLADPDPELQRAVASALAPWKLEVIVEPRAPASTAQAETRARALDARFVVWRRSGDLVVFDRDRGAAEHREGRRGRLDPASAAAAALTVKTLMRLPPPPPAAPPELRDPPPPPPPDDAEVAARGGPPAGGPEIRLQAGLATRIAHGSQTDLGARFAAAALVRPWRDRGWRIGLAGELGTSTTIHESGFKGTWSDGAVLALASGTIARGHWEIEPHLGAGVMRSVFEGTESSTMRHDTTLLGIARGGAWVRWRGGRWSAGGALTVDAVLGSPTYRKQSGNGDLFVVPGFAVALGAFAAVDLAP
ncbi:MAG: hypothetical protein ACTHU0_23640 [Kofleriaceae bacterium]